ncbi:MAG: type II 3-dehydroquinate dehydratase [Desulfovibrionaceae bacterium]
MRKVRILVLNGPNLGYIGVRQPEIYGSRTIEDLPEMVRDMLGLGPEEVELQFHQANSEGHCIDRLEQAWKDGLDGVVLNAGAYTHTSLALADCLAWIGIPTVEVHISNIFARTDEPLRQKSMIGKNCIGCIAGFGLTGYVLAILALWRQITDHPNFM